MKITRRQLRRIIKEAMGPGMGEKRMIIDDISAYGPFIYDADGEMMQLGKMIKDLIDSGQTDIFVNPEKAEANIKIMLQKDAEKVQRGMVNWDNNVFIDYYDVDLEKAIALWTEMNGYFPEWEDEGRDELTDEEREASQTEFDLESYYS